MSTPKTVDVTRGIEDLEDLLQDLGHLGAKINKLNKETYQCDFNNNERTQNVYTKTDEYVQSHNYKNEQYDNNPPEHSTPCSTQPNGFREIHTKGAVETSPTVNDLLFILDKPSPYCRTSNRTTPNLSSYDNMDDSDVDVNNNSTPEAAMEIHPGTVAKHVKSLQLKYNSSDDKTKPKYGVPLAGIVSPAASYQSSTPYCFPSKTKDSMEKELEIDVGVQAQCRFSLNSLYFKWLMLQDNDFTNLLRISLPKGDALKR